MASSKANAILIIIQDGVFLKNWQHKYSRKYNQLTELCNSANGYTYIFVT